MTRFAKLCAAALALIPTLAPMPAHADGAAPEMFGVREVVVQYAHFDDPKASDTCGLSREQVAGVLAKALANTGVPAVAVSDAKPPVLGVARIVLNPDISTHTDESLDCASWVAMSAESRSNAVIPPVQTLRSVTVTYWQQHTLVAGSQSTHAQTVSDVLAKMAAQFAQQYRLDQPPDLAK